MRRRGRMRKLACLTASVRMPRDAAITPGPLAQLPLKSSRPYATPEPQHRLRGRDLDVDISFVVVQHG